MVSRTSAKVIVLVFAAMVGTPSLAQVSTYYKQSTDGLPVPDVNKPNPSNTSDGTCWLATAANILAAAGYGTGGDSWTRANNIYTTQLVPGLAPGLQGGDPAEAIAWWLSNYGKNPDSAEYQPDNTYTDMTAFYGPVTPTEVNFLYSELQRCQYVGVTFDNPSHAMTLVGFDTNQGTSTWHDSDRSFNTDPNINPGDDVYTNTYSGTNQLTLYDPGIPGNYVNDANGYMLLCPGLNKPEVAVRNYDVAYFKANGVAQILETGALAPEIPDPYWDQNIFTDPQSGNTYNVFHLENQMDPVLDKRVYLLVDFYDRNANYEFEDILLRYIDEFGTTVEESPDIRQISPDNGQVLFTWELDNQPGWEELLFPVSSDYVFLENLVSSWDVATICVPEPSTLALAGLGLLGAAFCIRRKRLAGAFRRSGEFAG